MAEEDRIRRLESEGWKLRSLSGFIETAGPLWTRREDNDWAYGFLCEARHLNRAGVVHGGTLVTLLDHTISAVAWEATERSPCMTLQLDTHFMAAVREGQFAEARARVIRRTRRLVFMEGNITVEDEEVLAAQGIMKVVSAAPEN